MPGLDVRVNHNLSKDDAKRKINGLLDKLIEQYQDKISNVKQSWDGYIADFSFSFMGFDVSGKLFVRENDVLLDGTIPFPALPFKGMVQSKIKETATALLA